VLGDASHLETVRAGLDFLSRRSASPLYEALLPFGVLAAARFNAVHGPRLTLHLLADQLMILNDFEFRVWCSHLGVVDRTWVA